MWLIWKGQKKNHISLLLTQLTMELPRDQSPKCRGKCPLLEIEEQMYIDNVLTSNGADTIAKRIYEVIKDGEGISENLKALYENGLYRRNKNDWRQLLNRMYAIKWINK